MVERVAVDLCGGPAVAGAVFRYEVVARVQRAAAGQGVAFLGFGFAGPELRLVLDGGDDGVREVVRGVKVGTVRAARRWGVALPRGAHERAAAPDVLEALAWAHAVEPSRDPLATPWSSHRDLLGFRYAAFFDPRPTRARVDVRALHERCGGERLPDGWPPAAQDPAEVGVLLRVAASVLGVLPADRRCFRTFVHLARARGLTTRRIADALALTTRRVRQLHAEGEPLLEVARYCAAHPSLSRVP